MLWGRPSLILKNRRGRSQRLDGAFKAVECMSHSTSDDFEGFIVFVTADFALGHMSPSLFVEKFRMLLPIPGFMFITPKVFIGARA
jgi:hypothetical protein